MTRFLIGSAVLIAVLSYSGGGLPGFAAVLVVYLAVSRDLPFRRPPAAAMLSALLITALLQIVFLFTDARLRPDWIWLIVATFAFHGLAEELVWRGYVYRHLRAGRSFARAVLCTMPFVMAAHIPIVIDSGPVVGAAALLVAAVTAIPLARLYDLGRGTIWTPALVHAGIDSFKLVEVTTPAFPLLVSAAALVIPFLVFAVPGGRPGYEAARCESRYASMRSAGAGRPSAKP